MYRILKNKNPFNVILYKGFRDSILLELLIIQLRSAKLHL